MKIRLLTVVTLAMALTSCSKPIYFEAIAAFVVHRGERTDWKIGDAQESATGSLGGETCSISLRGMKTGVRRLSPSLQIKNLDEAHLRRFQETEYTCTILPGHVNDPQMETPFRIPSDVRPRIDKHADLQVNDEGDSITVWGPAIVPDMMDGAKTWKRIRRLSVVYEIELADGEPTFVVGHFKRK